MGFLRPYVRATDRAGFDSELLVISVLARLNCSTPPALLGVDSESRPRLRVQDFVECAAPRVFWDANRASPTTVLVERNAGTARSTSLSMLSYCLL